MPNILDHPLYTLKAGDPSRRVSDGRGRRPLGTATQLIQSTQMIRRMSLWLTFGMIVSLIGLMLLPWQQTSRGAGRVIAFQPGYRPQSITAPVDGIIADLPPHLYEGSHVQRGERLLTIQPIAADLETQLDQSVADLRQRLSSTEQMAEVYLTNVATLREAKNYAERAANELVSAAEARLRGAQAEIAGYEAKVDQLQKNYQRQRTLFEQGIKPLREIEILQQQVALARADLQSALQAVQSLGNEVENRRAEGGQRVRQATASIESAEAQYQRVLADASSIRKDIRDLEVRRSTLDRIHVTAPRSGVIHRLPLVEGGQTVKAGDYLLTFVPDTDDLAVELNVAGMDLPLVRVGQHVRLQFEGWPALQFSGWPQVSVGTFAGEIAVIDPTDDGSGVFRVLVRPEKDSDWPDEQWLRQGLRANGWIMMGTVSLGYEVWRQLNGFPPTIDPGVDGMDGKKSTGTKFKPPLPK
jgi:multidrug resistance efflux pump